MKNILIYILTFLSMVCVFISLSIISYGIEKPINIFTNSKGYSTFAEWDGIKGIDGYEIYYSKSKNGKFKLLKKVRKSQFTHKELEMNKKYYYKIRSYKGNKSIKYSSYSKIIEIKTKIVDKPKVYTKQKTYFGYKDSIITNRFEVAIANAGKYNIKILTNGKLSDVFDSKNNRQLRLITKVNGNYYNASSFIIKPKYYAPTVYYISKGEPTLYNCNYSIIKIYYEYQGKTFTKEVNEYLNYKYEDYIDGF